MSVEVILQDLERRILFHRHWRIVWSWAYSTVATATVIAAALASASVGFIGDSGEGKMVTAGLALTAMIFTSLEKILNMREKWDLHRNSQQGFEILRLRLLLDTPEDQAIVDEIANVTQSYSLQLGDLNRTSEGVVIGPNEVLVSIHYATNRKYGDKTDLNNYFGAEGSSSLNYGILEVSIPDSHKYGKLERPGLFTLGGEKAGKHIVLKRFLEMGEVAYFASLSEIVERLEDRTVFVFVHGFNVSFAEAARRTAQMTYDMFSPDIEEQKAKLIVAPIMFSWPSNGNTLSYPHDRESADESIPFLKSFLLDVTNRSGAEKIILIGHSMGGRLLSRALHEVGLAMQAEQGPIVTEIILAAPDIGIKRFEQLANEVMKTGHRITLYASNKDKALKASRGFNGNKRLGDARGGIHILNGVDSIDASTVGTDILAHSYLAKSSMLRDIHNIIMHSDPPGKRFGIKTKGKIPRRYWLIDD